MGKLVDAIIKVSHIRENLLYENEKQAYTEALKTFKEKDIEEITESDTKTMVNFLNKWMCRLDKEKTPRILYRKLQEAE